MQNFRIKFESDKITKIDISQLLCDVNDFAS